MGKLYIRLTVVVQLNPQPELPNLPVDGNIQPGDITVLRAVIFSTGKNHTNIPDK